MLPIKGSSRRLRALTPLYLNLIQRWLLSSLLLWVLLDRSGVFVVEDALGMVERFLRTFDLLLGVPEAILCTLKLILQLFF